MEKGTIEDIKGLSDELMAYFHKLESQGPPFLSPDKIDPLKEQAFELEQKLSQKALIDQHALQLKERDDAIERLKDMKAKLSTKMIGETLEQHCEIEFNKLTNY